MGYSYVFTNVKRDIYTTSYYLSDLSIVLVTSTFADNSETFRGLSTISQLTSATYFVGDAVSATSASVSVTSGSTYTDGLYGWIVKGLSDVTWTGVSFTGVAGALIYDPNFSNKLVCYIDFGGLNSSDAGIFVVPLTRGILQTP